MGGLKSWPTSNQATSRTRNTCAKVRKSGRCGSMSCTLTAARGHQPSQHILLCRSPNIWWRYARRGKRYKPSAAFAACATSSASTAARAAQRIFGCIEGASTYPKLGQRVLLKINCPVSSRRVTLSHYIYRLTRCLVTLQRDNDKTS